MNSKIRVEYDFDKKEPYIQLYIETGSSDQPDMRDGMLKHFVDQGKSNGLEIIYSDPSYGSPEIRISHSAKLNWVGLNAKCLISTNLNFEPGKSYNLLMATGDDHHVFIKGSGHIVRTNDEIEYNYLYEFAKCWEINDVGRFERSSLS